MSFSPWVSILLVGMCDLSGELCLSTTSGFKGGTGMDIIMEIIIIIITFAPDLSLSLFTWEKKRIAANPGSWIKAASVI